MKIQIRRGVFETNSSSVHSLTICSKEDYEKWESGELLYSRWNDCFVEATEENKEDKENYTYEKYEDDIEYETFYDTHTTKSGEVVIAFGYYGHD